MCICLSVIFAYSFETKQATVLKFWQMIDDIVGGAQKVLVTKRQGCYRGQGQHEKNVKCLILTETYRNLNI